MDQIVPTPGEVVDAPLTDAYRLLRRVEPPDAAYPGWIARTAGGTVHLVPFDALEAPWGGVSGDGHVLAPHDLVRCSGGTSAAVAWCPERLDRLLVRRAEAGAPLRAGEAVTVAVSVRRGLVELAALRRRGDPGWPAGEWWLTDEGRPVFVRRATGTDAATTALTVLQRAAEVCDDAAVCAALAACADVDALLTEATEEGLFRAGTPAPVRRDATPSPRRARSLDAVITPRAQTVSAPPRRMAWAQLVDADLAGLVAETWRGVRVRVGRRLSVRRVRPWWVAAAVAVAIVAGGALWPTEGAEQARAGDERGAVAHARDLDGADAGSPAASAGPIAKETVGPDEGEADAAARAEAVLGSLLDARRACGDDACLAEVVEDAGRALPPGAVDLAADARTVTFVEDFGGLMVFRVAPRGDGTERGQFVEIVETEGRWLIRDVHDIDGAG